MMPLDADPQPSDLSGEKNALTLRILGQIPEGQDDARVDMRAAIDLFDEQVRERADGRYLSKVAEMKKQIDALPPLPPATLAEFLQRHPQHNAMIPGSSRWYRSPGRSTRADEARALVHGSASSDRLVDAITANTAALVANTEARRRRDDDGSTEGQ